MLAPAGPLARRAGAYSPAILSATEFVAFNARRGPFASARVRRAAAAALSRSSIAAALNLVPASGLLPPGIAVTPPIVLAPAPRRGSIVGAVMAVEAGCDPCERAYPLVRAALSSVGIAVRRRAGGLAEVRRRPQAFDLLLAGAELEYPDPATFLARALTDAMPSTWLPATTVVALRELRPLFGTAREHAAIALAVELAERDAPVAALGHPAIGQLLSARLGCRVPSRFGVNLAALCLR